MTEALTQTLPILTGKWFEIGQQFLESTARNIQHLGAGPNSLEEACDEQLETTRSAIFKTLDFQRAMLEEWKRETSKLPSEPNSYAALADVVEKGLETRVILWRAWFHTAQQLQRLDSAESLWRTLPLPAETLYPWRLLAEAMAALQKATPDTAPPANVQDSDEDSNPSRRGRAAQKRGA